MKPFLLFLIRFYQRCISFDSGIVHILFPHYRVCRFEPRCSEYMYQAISRYGIIRGLFLGMKRIGRCHPWGKSGWDPVK